MKDTKQATSSVENILKEKYPDLPEEFRSDYLAIRDFTMVNVARSYALWEAVNYICRGRLEGSYVECGVWKGGQSMLAALAFKRQERYPDLELYDTFAGMSEPTDRDVRVKDQKPAFAKWAAKHSATHNEWAYAPLNEVKSNMHRTGYPTDKIHFRVGMVEHTLLTSVPDKIAILRLDTDWYESTKAEMECLFPRLVRGGVLIIDDYGYWQGAKAAVDEYLARNQIDVYLSRIDRTGRVAILTG